MNDSLKMPTIRDNRRVVLEHRTGRCAGIFQIMGHVSEFEDNVPSVAAPINPWPRTDRIMADLVKSTPRYVLYRESGSEKESES